MNPIPIPTEIAEAYPDAEKRIFGPPQGVPDEECGTVEILVAPYEMGGATRVFHAYFRPTADELAVLNAGGLFEVSQVGNVLQPFAANVLVVESGAGFVGIGGPPADMADVDAIGAPDPAFDALVADEADPNRDKASGR